MLKAKPNLESRIRALKRDWSIVYDMLSGKNNSGCGWDEHRQLVVAEDVVYRATGKDAQTAADIIEEINVEDVATTSTREEKNDFHRCEADVSLDDMDLLATQSQPASNQGDSTFSKKKKKDF
ncbi:hypothetical protein PVK06_007524 [Gossypium arboreum]|uniref:Myb/SANT-like domain-containing protein n=1 Tax=Gossypium arboreum TaxID=29729 RepID=A0ABR0QHN0_GOSAR|nr:hypothetical protein PVK06_007524 [Gossypium arboreum]